jgi:LPS sulfotransferase NodH
MDQDAISRIENAREKVFVCATQCSGSKMLCSLLQSTGVAGAPEEHFYLWMRGEQTFSDAVDHCFQNQIFGLKIMANYRAKLEFSLKRIWREKGKGSGFLSFMDDAIWLYLIRKDRLRQAISRFTKRIATVRGISLIDFHRKNEAVVFDYYDIRKIIETELNLEYHYWDLYFSNNGIKPYVVYFEEICSDPAVVVHILEKNGLRPGGLPKSNTEKESSKLNELFGTLYGLVDILAGTSQSVTTGIEAIDKALSEEIDKEYYSDALSLQAIERNLEAAKMNILDFPSRRWNLQQKWHFFDRTFFEDLSRLLINNFRH